MCAHRACILHARMTSSMLAWADQLYLLTLPPSPTFSFSSPFSAHSGCRRPDCAASTHASSTLTQSSIASELPTARPTGASIQHAASHASSTCPACHALTRVHAGTWARTVSISYGSATSHSPLCSAVSAQTAAAAAAAAAP